MLRAFPNAIWSEHEDVGYIYFINQDIDFSIHYKEDRIIRGFILSGRLERTLREIGKSDYFIEES